MVLPCSASEVASVCAVGSTVEARRAFSALVVRVDRDKGIKSKVDADADLDGGPGGFMSRDEWIDGAGNSGVPQTNLS